MPRLELEISPVMMMRVFVLFLCISCATRVTQCSIELDGKTVEELSRFLRLHDVVVVADVFSEGIRVRRSLLRERQTIKVVSLESNTLVGKEDSLIIDLTRRTLNDPEMLNLIEHMGGMTPCVFVLEDGKGLSSLFKINQRAYKLSLEEGVISEAYTVGEVSVDKVVAIYDEGTNRFVSQEGVSGAFEARRSNFHGAHLKTLVCPQSPHMTIASPDPKRTDLVDQLYQGLELEIVHYHQMKGLFRDLQVVKG